MRQVVVAGATGLVGREILRALAERKDVRVHALVRRSGALAGAEGAPEEVPFDYEDEASYARLGTEIPCDVLLCTLGTTLKRAGSKEAFCRVDRDYPAALMARLAALEPRPVFGLVSAAGAGHPKGFYLETKAQAEKALMDAGLPYVLVRPSLLLGRRSEFRPGERLMQVLLARPYLFLARSFAPQARTLWRYAPIEASAVAQALVRACLDLPPTELPKVLSGLALHHPILGL